ncbi:DNA/RNA helicase, superfamily II [Sphaerochaeta pleomorpha str. Grapes]|uniref:DNA/RNA helicase, superfamily II n=1 Tax=Sphaerochaeta pleomorpha (strain ATCC BAA-1885 / DSM 22778 / Grapes) TaxID=158190 RepID=G8QUV7_SPHPG|nr:DEAD/DEAH box helicase [Sphaerochaeta pleomorpha]AEV28133.1 DNA/RNA helicase, superfamily II [Sphaerochaeta pleomorpha str. Grapes]
MSFISLGISESLVTALEHDNITTPYPIQTEVIPAILSNNDILGIAKTGSGKTLSYVLPILMHLQKKEVLKNRQIQVLVMVPTRELAAQVNSVFSQYIHQTALDLKTLAVFGGTSINSQMMVMRNLSILVATPGRLLELISLHAVHLSSLEIVVIDEADKMLTVGFEQEMDQIFAQIPKQRQNLLFSATLNEQIQSLEKVLLHDPVVIKIEEEDASFDLIQQSVYCIAEEKKGPLLRHLIKSQNMKQVLIFTSSVARADRVAEKLQKNGIDAESIHSRKSQGARTDLLRAFKQGNLRVLVTTDLLARGIDIESLPFVINYELPRSPINFIHRIGRTGRAGNSGEAITLINPSEETHFKVIEKKMKKKVTRIPWKGTDLVNA